MLRLSIITLILLIVLMANAVGLVAEPETNRIVQPVAVFKPEPWQVPVWKCKAKVVLLTGSAGGGKSKIAAEKVHAFCLKYPGVQAIIARKVKASLTNGTVLFLEKEIIGEGNPLVTHKPGKSRFDYANGSILTYIGIKDKNDRRKLRSIGLKGGADIVWMEEATEFDEDDYNALLARLRGTAAGWRQIILSTNPDTPTHWIYRRLIQAGEAVVFESKASDNPYNPDDYQDTLNAMTGVEGERLRDGKWVNATGLIYKEWSDSESVTDLAEYQAGAGDIYWGVDDGYAGTIDKETGSYSANSHPRAFLLGQLRSNGTLCIFAESYACGMLSNNHIDKVVEMGYPAPQYVAVDKSAAELKGWFAEKDFYTRNSPSSVAESIKVTRNWIAKDKNGVRRVLVHPRCKQFRAEMLSYRYNPITQDPIKEYDHGPDTLRYLIHNLQSAN